MSLPAFELGIWNAWIFMIFLLLPGFVVRLIAKEVYEKAGHPSDMKLSTTQKKIGIGSTLIWLLATLYSIFLPLQLGTTWFYTGFVIFLLGLVMLTIATVNFAATPLDEPVTAGIYRYSRNPMYLAMFLIYVGVSIASASWIFLVLSIVVPILTHFGATVPEERYCLEKYGDDYREYMKRTPRWIGIPKSRKN
jgi:protein-S-isoprenylcysteine O-methyltransferase Ste14